MEDDKKNGQHWAVALIGRNLLLRKEQTLFRGFVSGQSDVVSCEVFLAGKDYICVHHMLGAQLSVRPKYSHVPQVSFFFNYISEV